MKDCVTCAHEYLSPMSDTCRECGIAMLNYKEAKPITSADRIRAMTDEELRLFFEELLMHCGSDCCHGCPLYDCCFDKGINDWLKEETKE